MWRLSCYPVAAGTCFCSYDQNPWNSTFRYPLTPVTTGFSRPCENHQLDEKKWRNLTVVKPRRYWVRWLCTKQVWAVISSLHLLPVFSSFSSFWAESLCCKSSKHTGKGSENCFRPHSVWDSWHCWLFFGNPESGFINASLAFGKPDCAFANAKHKTQNIKRKISTYLARSHVFWHANST